MKENFEEISQKIGSYKESLHNHKLGLTAGNIANNYNCSNIVSQNENNDNSNNNNNDNMTQQNSDYVIPPTTDSKTRSKPQKIKNPNTNRRKLPAAVGVPLSLPGRLNTGGPGSLN